MEKGVVQNAVLGNYWTTLWGCLGGIALYVTQNGIVMPTTPQEWKSLAASLFIVALGVAAKDSNVGVRAP